MAENTENVPNSRKKSSFRRFTTIRNRLIFSLIIILVMMVSLVGITIGQIGNIIQKSLFVAESTQPSQIYAYALLSEVNLSNLQLQLYLTDKNTNSNLKERRQIIWEKNINAYQDSLTTLSVNWDSNDEKLLLANVISNLDRLSEIQDLIEKYVDEDYAFKAEDEIINVDGQKVFARTVNPQTVFNERVVSITNTIRADLNKLNTFHNQTRTRVEANIQEDLNYAIIIEGIIILFAILITVVLIGALLRSLRKSVALIQNYLSDFTKGDLPAIRIDTRNEISLLTKDFQAFGQNLQKVKDFALEVGSGNFESDIDVFQNQGEIGSSLAEMKSSLAKVAQENRIRNWMNEGLTLFSNLIRGADENFQELFDAFISNLIRYLEAQQGAIFLKTYDEINNQEFMQLRSLYAFEKNRFMQKNILKGEGLIGQAWREKDTIYITDVPDNYTLILSGMGKSKPQSIFITPILSSELEVLGVIEVSALYELQPYKIDLVKQVADILASLVASTQQSESSNRQLKEYQDTAEELRGQEETMRKNMEKLLVSQERMQERQLELKGRKEAVDSVMATVEYRMDSTIITANNIFLDISKYDLDEIEDKPYSMFVSSIDSSRNINRQLWRRLGEGVPQVGEFRIIGSDNSEIWLSASFTVIKNEKGVPQKVIQFARDITETKLASLDLEGQKSAIEKTTAILELNMNGIIKTVNPLFLEMADYSLEDLRGQNCRVLIPDTSEDIEKENSRWEKLKMGRQSDTRFRILTKNRNMIWIRGIYIPILNYDRKPIKIILFVYNISELIEQQEKITSLNQKIIEQGTKAQQLQGQIEFNSSENTQLKNQLQNTQQSFQTLQGEYNAQMLALDNSFAKVEFNRKGVIQKANDKFLELFGYRRMSDMKGVNHKTLIDSTEAVSGEYIQFWDDLRDGITQNSKFTYVDKDKNVLFIQSIYTPIRDSKGRAFKIIALASVPEEIQKEIS